LKNLYFTSDWHVGHEKVLHFDQRPFSTLTEMHETLIKRFNRLVPKHGITYFLGDMGLTSVNTLKDIINELNGKKILVLGNHDGKIQSMYNAGFDFVTYKAQLAYGKVIITLSHCPLTGVFREDVTGMRGATEGECWHKETKFKHMFSFPDFGQKHLHGHTHCSSINGKEIYTHNQVDVGVPAHNYYPVSFSRIASWIVSGVLPPIPY